MRNFGRLAAARVLAAARDDVGRGGIRRHEVELRGGSKRGRGRAEDAEVREHVRVADRHRGEKLRRAARADAVTAAARACVREVLRLRPVRLTLRVVHERLRGVKRIFRLKSI